VITYPKALPEELGGIGARQTGGKSQRVIQREAEFKEQQEQLLKSKRDIDKLMKGFIKGKRQQPTGPDLPITLPPKETKKPVETMNVQ
jgi:hypothetical protein